MEKETLKIKGIDGFMKLNKKFVIFIVTIWASAFAGVAFLFLYTPLPLSEFDRKIELNVGFDSIFLCGTKIEITDELEELMYNRFKSKRSGSHAVNFYSIDFTMSDSTSFIFSIGEDSNNKERRKHLYWLYSADGHRIGSPLAYLRSSFLTDLIKKSCNSMLVRNRVRQK